MLDELLLASIVLSLFSYGFYIVTTKERMILFKPFQWLSRKISKRGNKIRVELSDPYYISWEEKLWMMFSCPNCCVSGYGIVLYLINSFIPEQAQLYFFSDLYLYPLLTIPLLVMASTLNALWDKIIDHE